MDGKTIIGFEKNTSAQNDNSNSEYSNFLDNRWYFITYIFSKNIGGINRLYINGEINYIKSQTINWNFNNQDIILGDSPYNFWEEFKGYIDDFRVYSRALSEDEVKQLYFENSYLPGANNLKIVDYSTNSINLQWDKVSWATGYNIYRSDSENGVWELIGTTQSNDFTDIGLVENQKYYYRVKSYNAKLISDYSGSVLGICSNIPKIGIIGEWLFDGNANDTSGNNNNGVVNGATPAKDRFGEANKSYSFDGVNDYIGLNNMILKNQSDFTISSWVKIPSSINYEFCIYRENNGGWLKNGFEIQVQSDFSISTLWSDSSGMSMASKSLTSKSKLNLLEWYNIVAVRKSNILSIYINSIKDGEIITSSSISSSINGIIGGWYVSNIGSYYNRGYVDDIRVYNRVLSPVEINKLFNENNYVTKPQNLKVTEYSTNSIKLIWDSVSDAASYKIYRCNTIDGTYSVINTTTNNYYLDTGLTESQSYYYKITATKQIGESEPTDIVKGISSSIPRVGLIGEWLLDGNADDSSGNNYNGTIYGSVTTAMDRFGTDKAMSFLNGYIQNTAVFQSTMVTNFTVDFWIYPVTMIDSNNHIMAKNGWGAFAFHCGSGNNIVIGTRADSRYILPIMEYNKWQHIVFTYNNGYARLYKNGNIVYESTMYNPTTVWGGFQIGYNPSNCRFDDVRVYNRALERYDVLKLYQENNYNNERPSIPTKTQIKNGLMGEWTFSGNPYDSSGNCLDGTLYNGVTPGTDRFGVANRAYNFDGIDDYIQLTKLPANISTNDGFSASVWVYYRSFKYWSRMFDFSNGTPNNNIALANETTTNNLVFGVTNGTTTTYSHSLANNIEVNNWINYIVTIDKNKINKVYKNGVLIYYKDNFELPNNVIRSNNYFGKSAWSTDGCFDGLLDDIRIYNRALTRDEIQNLYHEDNYQGSPITTQIKSPVTNGLIGEWTFSGNAIDSSGNCNDGVVNFVTPTVDRFGNEKSAYYFDGGVDHNIIIPTNSSFDMPNYVGTYCFWFKTAGGWETGGTDPDNNASIISRTVNPTNNGNGVFLNYACIWEHRDDATLSNYFSTNGANNFTNNKWYFITYCFSRLNGGTIKLYVNGKLNSINPASLSWSFVNNPPLYIGDSSDAYWEEFKGIIDDIRIYDRTLSDAEILSLYNEGGWSGN